jgi:hypothetical protein
MDLIVELRERENGKGIDLRVATFSLFGMMNWIYTWYQPKRDLPLRQLTEQMLRIYFFGVLQGGAMEAPWFDSAVAASGKETFSLWENHR